MNAKAIFLGLLSLVASAVNARAANAQNGSSPATQPTVTFDGRGITIRGTDSVTSVNLRFRLQEVAALSSRDDSPFALRPAYDE